MYAHICVKPFLHFVIYFKVNKGDIEENKPLFPENKGDIEENKPELQWQRASDKEENPSTNSQTGLLWAEITTKKQNPLPIFF